MQDAITAVEFMVAEREIVKADVVHHLGICLALKEGEILCASDRVTRMDLDEIGQFGNRFEHAHLTRKSPQRHLGTLAADG